MRLKMLKDARGCDENAQGQVQPAKVYKKDAVVEVSESLGRCFLARKEAQVFEGEIPKAAPAAEENKDLGAAPENKSRGRKKKDAE